MNLLLVRHALHQTGQVMTLGEPKTPKSKRALNMPKAVSDALKSHLDRQEDEMDAAGELWVHANLVFPTSLGTATDHRHYRRSFQRAATAAGIEGEWTPHELRHSCVSLLSASGVPLEQVADLVGHASTRMTAEIYRHQVSPTVDAAVSPMDDMFSVVSSPRSIAFEKGGVLMSVIALIPAHNEEDTILQTLHSLAEQTVPLARVVVVADNCTDRTVDVVRRAGVAVMETQGNTHMKAGALNAGLELLLPSCSPNDFVLIMDADSRLVPGFVETAARELNIHPWAGAVCASFAGEEDRRGAIHVFQRNEYARFARSIARRKATAQVLSGVATMFTAGLLSKIREGRDNGRLPPAPGVYEVTAATEDIEMTFAVRKLGYCPTAPLGCRAFTDTMSTWKSLAIQRIRWQRGMLDALRLYRLNRQTLPSALRLAGVYLGSLAPVLLVGLLLASFLVLHKIEYQPLWLLILPLFAFERVWTVRHLGWREMAMSVLLIPEWIYDNFRSGVYWLALVRWHRQTERVWVPT